MKPITKIIAILLSLGLFIWISSIYKVNALLWQLGLLALSSFLIVVRYGIKKLWIELKLFLPFTLSMLIIYLLIGALGFEIPMKLTGNSAIVSWLLYGLNRCLLFISTLLFFQFALSFITLEDVISLPFRIHSKKYLLLGRALFNHAVNSLENLEMHLHIIPEYQVVKLKPKQYLALKLQLTYSILCLLIRESRLKGEMIDNRIKHCFK